MSGHRPAWYTAEEITARVPADRARRLVRAVLREGFDPAADPARVSTPAGPGHLLLMPSTIGRWTGVKIASVAPGNPERGLPRIQAVYVLLDSATLTPRALLEGSVLTALRTPAVSAVAADALAPSGAEHLVVFGTGPQAIGHAEAFARIRALRRVTVVGRRPGRVRDAVRAVGGRLGDVVLAVRDGVLAEEALVPLREVVTGTVARRADAPTVFKGVGMSWQDLAVAVGVVDPDA